MTPQRNDGTVHHEILAAWFPLVPRPRPEQRPLETRIAGVATAAHRARTRVEASMALNAAALIASDTGTSGLAADVCWRQFQTFRNHAPLGGDEAEGAMEPIINLARLAIRDGDGDRGFTLLEQTLNAARNATSTTIDGNTIDFAALVTGEGRRAAHQRLWVAILSDGTRALARAGRWKDACEAAEQRNGLGSRLLDGRQVAIIARYTAGDLPGALTLISNTVADTDWEQTVALYLETLCAASRETATTRTYARLIEQYLQLHHPASELVFQTRLGLSILTLTWRSGTETNSLAEALAETVLAAGDGYAARDLLGSRAAMGHLGPETLNALGEAVTRSGLNFGPLPQLRRQQLQIAIDVALTRLDHVL